ncbi:hypothetical protein WDU94_010288, partial [Cyamophila willieti]
DTKIIQTLINSLDKDNVHRLATLYKNILNEKQQQNGEQRTNGTPSKKQRHTNNITLFDSYNNKDKIYILNLLTKLVLHPSLNRDHRVTPIPQGGKVSSGTGDSEEQVEYVFDLALGVSPWSHELAAAYKKALFSLLGHQLHHELLERLVNHANQLVVKGQTKNIKMTPEISACWSQCQDMINNLKKKIATAAGKSSKSSIDSVGLKKSILIAFHTMYLQLCLYLFLDNSISIDVIEELNHCYERFDEKKKTSVDSEEPHWIEVITELFLSLLSKDSQLLRHLVTKVFKLLVPTLTVQTVKQILQVLDPSKNPLKGDGLEESDDEEDNDDEENEASQDEENEEEEEAEEEEESDIDEEYLGNETNTDKLRQIVNQALGMNGNVTDAESVDMSDIDPAEARQLDAALASAFSSVKKPSSSSSRPNKHQAKAEARLVSFRVRVLDLIETYSSVSSQAGPAMLDILSSLFVLLKYTSTKPSQKPLETRLRAVLKQFGSAGVKKSNSVGSVTGDNIVTDQLLADVLTNSVLDKGDTSMSTVHTMGGEICSAILYLARAHSSTLSTNVTYEQLAQSKFVQCLLNTLECFFTKRACIVPGHLFKSLLAISWPGNVLFFPVLSQYAFSPALRYYHRATALSLLYVLLRNRHLMDTVREDPASLKRVETSLSQVLEKTGQFVQDSSELSKAIATYTRTLCDVILTIKARPDIIKTKQVDGLLRSALGSGVSCPALTRLYRAFDIK